MRRVMNECREWEGSGITRLFPHGLSDSDREVARMKGQGFTHPRSTGLFLCHGLLPPSPRESGARCRWRNE